MDSGLPEPGQQGGLHVQPPPAGPGMSTARLPLLCARPGPAAQAVSRGQRPHKCLSGAMSTSLMFQSLFRKMTF